MITEYLNDLEQTAIKYLKENGYTGNEFSVEKFKESNKYSLKLGLDVKLFKADIDKFATLDFTLKSKYRLSVKSNLLKLMDSEASAVDNSKSKYINKDFETLTELFEEAKKAFYAEVEAYSPSYTFGCCSKYKECSDAKKCLHEYKLYAKGCQYRKNLENGLIFYGNNRNI